MDEEGSSTSDVEEIVFTPPRKMVRMDTVVDHATTLTTKTPNTVLGVTTTTTATTPTHHETNAVDAVDPITLNGALPPIFVISKQRCWKRKGTLEMLCTEGIAATVVVEPCEREEYNAWLEGSNIAVHVLPADNKGVSFARNEILRLLASRMRNVASDPGWFWILDDDVSVFKHTDKGVTKVIPARSALQRPMSTDEKLCLYALEYGTFSYGLKKYCVGNVAHNGYCNVCVCIAFARVPSSIRYRFAVREDLDFALQLLRAGYHTMRLRWVSFDAPSMGSAKGGMYDYYQSQEMIDETNRFLREWPYLTRRKETKTRKFDVKVLWAELPKLMHLQVMKQREQEKKAMLCC